MSEFNIYRRDRRERRVKSFKRQYKKIISLLNPDTLIVLCDLRALCGKNE